VACRLAAQGALARVQRRYRAAGFVDTNPNININASSHLVAFRLAPQGALARVQRRYRAAVLPEGDGVELAPQRGVEVVAALLDVRRVVPAVPTAEPEDVLQALLLA
jgi:hypothetical protein